MNDPSERTNDDDDEKQDRKVAKIKIKAAEKSNP